MRTTKISLLLLHVFASILVLTQATSAGETLKAQPGLFRLLSADILEKDAYNFGASFEFFQQGGLLKDGTANSTVRRTQGILAFGYALTQNIQIAGNGGFTITSKRPQAASTTSAASETIDLVKMSLAAMANYDVGAWLFGFKPHRFTAGGSLEVDFSKITRFFSGPNIIPTLAFTNDFTDAQVIPLRLHLNVGFRPGNGSRYYDKSDHNVRDLDRFATDTINSYALTGGLGMDFPMRVVTPSIEFHIQKVQEAGFSNSPKWVTPGIKARPFPQKNVELIAGVDIGLSSFKATPATTPPYAKPAVGPVPLWNIVVGFSVSKFGKRANEIAVDQIQYEGMKESIATKEVMLAGLQKDLEYNTIQGRVIDAKTKEPVGGVQLSFPDSPDLKGSTSEEDGHFIRYFHHLAGARLVFSKSGYEPSSKFLALKPGERVNVDIEMARSTGEAQTVFVATITDSEGLGVAASITFTNMTTKESYIATADGAGQINVKVKPGTYSLQIKANGMQGSTDQLEFESGKTVLRTYSLIKDRSAPAPKNP